MATFRRNAGDTGERSMDFKDAFGHGWAPMTRDDGVTAQGASVELVKQKVLKTLEEGPLSPRDVVSRVTLVVGVSDEQVRNVIWKLIDRGFVDPDDALRLSLRRPK